MGVDVVGVAVVGVVTVVGFAVVGAFVEGAAVVGAAVVGATKFPLIQSMYGITLVYTPGKNELPQTPPQLVCIPASLPLQIKGPPSSL